MTDTEAEQRVKARMERRATMAVATPPTPTAKILRSSDMVGDCKRRMNAAERKYRQAERAIETADRRATVAWNEYLKVKLEYETAKSPTDQAHRRDEAKPHQ